MLPQQLSILLFLGVSIFCKDLCFLHLSDINVKEFFANVPTSSQDQNVNENRYNKSIHYDNIYDTCDISNSNMSIKLVMDDIDSFIEMIEVLNITPLKYLTDFYNFVSNGPVIKSYDLISFLFGVNFKLDKYVRPETNLNMNIEKTLSMFQPDNYTMNRTLITSFGDENIVPSNHWVLKMGESSVKNRDISIVLTEFTETSRRERRSGVHPKDNFYQRTSMWFQELFGVYKYNKLGNKKGVSLAESLYNLVFLYDKEYFYDVLDKGFGRLRKANNKLSGVFKSRILYFQLFWAKLMSDDKIVKLKNTVWDMMWFGRKTKLLLDFAKTSINNPNFNFKIERLGIMNKRFRVLDDQYKILHHSYVSQQNYDIEIPSTESVLRSINYPKGPINYLRHKQNSMYGVYDKYMREGDRRAIPEYGSDEIWVMNPIDFFDPDFWWYESAHFTGFHPSDRREIRPTNPFAWLSLAYPSGLATISFVPADGISIGIWTWKWFLRSNTTLTFLPWLAFLYEEPDTMACLPGFPYPPDPRIGCAPPTLQNVPPSISEEGFEDLMNPLACLPWSFNPLNSIEGILQVILSPLSYDFVQQNVIVSFILGLLPITIVVDPEDIPEIQAYCILPQLFLTAIILIIAIGLGIELLIIFFAEASRIFSDIRGIKSDTDWADIKQELLFLEKPILLTSVVIQQLINLLIEKEKEKQD